MKPLPRPGMRGAAGLEKALRWLTQTMAERKGHTFVRSVNWHRIIDPTGDNHSFHITCTKCGASARFVLYPSESNHGKSVMGEAIDWGCPGSEYNDIVR
jgi:hypothetical protein